MTDDTQDQEQPEQTETLRAATIDLDVLHGAALTGRCVELVKAALDKSSTKLDKQPGKALAQVRAALTDGVRFTLKGAETGIPKRLPSDVVTALQGKKSPDQVKAQIAEQKASKRPAPVSKGGKPSK